LFSAAALEQGAYSKISRVLLRKHVPANTKSYLLITTNTLTDNSKHAIYPSFTATEVQGSELACWQMSQLIGRVIY